MELTNGIRNYLQQPLFPVLATINPNGTPQQSVIWFELVGDEILMNTRRGRRKDRNLRRDPRASLCFVDGYRYVTIRGITRLVDDQETAQADIRRLATRYGGPEKAEQQMATQFGREERVTVWLSIQGIVGYGYD